MGFVLAAFNRFRLAQRRGRLCIRQRKRAGSHFAERLLEKLLHLRRVHIAKDENNAVFSDHVTIAKLDQIFLRQPLHGLDRTV